MPIIRRTYSICATLVFSTLYRWLSGLLVGMLIPPSRTDPPTERPDIKTKCAESSQSVSSYHATRRESPSWSTHFISRAVLSMAFWLLKTRSTSWRRIVSVSTGCPGACPAAVTGMWHWKFYSETNVTNNAAIATNMTITKAVFYAKRPNTVVPQLSGSKTEMEVRMTHKSVSLRGKSMV